MKKGDIICYEGKSIKILLKNNFVYTCVIQEFLDDCIRVKDRFGNLVTISLGNISMITEVRRAENGRE